MSHAYLRGPGPVALAHRGGGLEAPENSRAAIEHMRSVGLRYLETDVRTTADGVVVLFHDETLDRTTDGTGPVSARTWAELSRVRNAAGEAPLRLEEVLADYPDLHLNIDAKDDAAVDRLVGIVADADAHERVCLASFYDQRIQRLRRAFDGVVCTSLARGETARLVAAAYQPAAVRRRALRGVPGPERGARAIQVPERLRGIRVLTPAVIRAAHERGLDVHVWTVNDEADMRRLLAMGVDGLVSDRPTALRSVLEARGAWH